MPIIQAQIERFFTSYLVQGYKEATGSPLVAENAFYSALESAIRKGKVIYRDGKFVFVGNTSKEIVQEIKELGGSYKRSDKLYHLPKDNLPSSVQSAIESAEQANIRKSNKLLDYFRNFDIAKATESLNFTDSFVAIVNQAKNFVDRTTPKSVGFARDGIIRDWSKQEVEGVATDYSHNLTKYVKDFAEETILKIRADVVENIKAGNLSSALEEILQARYNTSKRKARFLSRQETRLCITAQTVARAKEYGIDRYVWMGGTRPDHAMLNGKEFDFNNDPITNQRTKARNKPGEDYNCKCSMKLIVDV